LFEEIAEGLPPLAENPRRLTQFLAFLIRALVFDSLVANSTQSQSSDVVFLF
jgi:hypothetical protein